MSSSRNRNRRKNKAVHPAIAARAGRPNTPVGTQLTPAMLNALTNAPAGAVMNPLPRDPRDDNPFGPLNPLIAQPLDQARRDTGRPEPRLSEYDVGWNIPGGGQRRTPWRVLREASRDVDVLRRCIQIRKSHVTGLKWAWTLSESAVEEAMLSGKHTSRLDAEGELREQMQSEIARLTAFWERPWRANNMSFGQWIGLALEEILSIDALAVYPQLTLGGDLLNFEILDGSTIKPLRDWRGALPQPGYPAYQQEIYGFPRGEFTATMIDTPQGVIVPGAFLADQLYYYRSVVFSDTPYGMSAVEQSLISARLYLMRQGWLLAEYDDGVAPNTWLVADKDVANLGNEPFTVQKRREWQQALNDDLRGNTRERQRAQLTPPGFTPAWSPTVDEQFKADYDQHLITLLTAHMDVTMAEYGFSMTGGLGATGFHEGQEDVQDRKATRPTCEMLAGIIVELSRCYLGAPPQLAFKFLGLEQEDEAAQDAVASDRVQYGRMTLNEDRDRQGKPRYTFPEADMPMLLTARGIVFIEGSSQTTAPGEMVAPAQAPPELPGAPQQGQDDEDEDEQDGQDEQDDGKPKVGKASRAQAAEIAAFNRYRAKAGNTPARPFLFKSMTASEAIARKVVGASEIGVTAAFSPKV